MPLIDNATLLVGAGNYFTAPVGTAIPDLLTEEPPQPWDNIGHTDLEEVLSIASEGGEQTVIGTLQNKNLRVRIAPRSETIAVPLQQFDIGALRLYYGSNAVDVNGDGSLLGVPQTPAPTERAFLAIFLDGETVFAIYAPKASIFRGADLEIADTESLATLPLTVTPLVHGTNKWAYAVTPLAQVATPEG